MALEQTRSRAANFIDRIRGLRRDVNDVFFFYPVPNGKIGRRAHFARLGQSACVPDGSRRCATQWIYELSVGRGQPVGPLLAASSDAGGIAADPSAECPVWVLSAPRSAGGALTPIPGWPRPLGPVRVFIVFHGDTQLLEGLAESRDSAVAAVGALPPCDALPAAAGSLWWIALPQSEASNPTSSTPRSLARCRATRRYCSPC